MQKKYIMIEDNNIQVHSMSIILLIFMNDIFFFCKCLIRDVLPLLSTVLYDFKVK